MVKDLSLAFNINETSNYHMVHFIRNALEIETGDEFERLGVSHIDSCKLISVINAEILKHQKIAAHDGILLCTECGKRSARLQCNQCNDQFCASCHESTHLTGKRRLHTCTPLEQLVCAVCDQLPAECTISRGKCGTMFCYKCLDDAQKADLSLLECKKTYLEGFQCLSCHTAISEWACDNCEDTFCSLCFHRLHHRGKMSKHTCSWLSPDGSIWRDGDILDPVDAQLNLEKARRSAVTSKFISYLDDQSVSFWLDLETDKICQTRPPID